MVVARSLLCHGGAGLRPSRRSLCVHAGSEAEPIPSSPAQLSPKPTGSRPPARKPQQQKPILPELDAPRRWNKQDSATSSSSAASSRSSPPSTSTSTSQPTPAQQKEWPARGPARGKVGKPNASTRSRAEEQYRKETEAAKQQGKPKPAAPKTPAAQDDYDEGEVVDMTQEEIDKMIFGNTDAWIAPEPAEEPAPKPAASGKGGNINAVLQKLEVPEGLQALIQDAVQLGRLSTKPAALEGQLQAALECKALAGQAKTAAWASIANWAQAAVSGLTLNQSDAAAVAIRFPQYLEVPFPELRTRLEAFASSCEISLQRATGLVASNPALLLVPRDMLLAKLIALQKATGLSLEQATSMISLYMFQ